MVPTAGSDCKRNMAPQKLHRGRSLKMKISPHYWELEALTRRRAWIADNRLNVSVLGQRCRGNKSTPTHPSRRPLSSRSARFSVQICEAGDRPVRSLRNRQGSPRRWLGRSIETPRLQPSPNRNRRRSFPDSRPTETTFQACGPAQPALRRWLEIVTTAFQFRYEACRTQRDIADLTSLPQSPMLERPLAHATTPQALQPRVLGPSPSCKSFRSSRPAR
jgi:hypothetical protein